MNASRMILAFACCLNTASGLGVPRLADLNLSGEPSTHYTAAAFGGCDREIEIRSTMYSDWSWTARNLPQIDRLGWTGRYRYAGAFDTGITTQWSSVLSDQVAMAIGEKPPAPNAPREK